MATLTDSTNLTGTITLSKATGTKVTLDTDKKYLTKDIELTINAPTTSVTANGATVSYGEGWISAGSTTVTDNNLIAENIKKDVSIFGVTGTLVSENLMIEDTIDENGGTIRTITSITDPIMLQEKQNIIPSTSNITVLPDNGYDGLTSVQINGDSNLIAENIKAGTSIFGVTGTFSSGADIPVFDKLYSADSSTYTMSCNKTFSECYNLYPLYGDARAFLCTRNQEGWEQNEPATAVNAVENDYIEYTICGPWGPMYDIVYHANGTIDYVEPSTYASILNATANGDYYPSKGVYNEVRVNVPSSAPNLQAKMNISPTESSQTIQADSGYDGLSSVQINAISSTYVGTGITRRTYNDLIINGADITVPSGYYANNSGKSVASGFATAPAGISGTGASVTTSTNTLTLTKTVSVTPTVSAGYISAGTAGNSSVSLTASVTTKAAATITPSETAQEIAAGTYLTGKQTISAIPNTYVGSGITSRSSSDLTASGATVTVPAGYYASDATKSVSTMTLPTSAASSATSGYTSKATIGRSASAQYINIPVGYNSAGGYYTISATPNGSATAPSTISGTSAAVSTGTNTLTLTKTVSVTPTVTAGYVSSGTAGNTSVSLTASVTTKAAATITPSTSNQTIASGTYLTGTQTITGDANLVGSNIISGKSIFGVAGTVAFQTYYTGSSTPASSLGSNGDIYLMT